MSRGFVIAPNLTDIDSTKLSTMHSLCQRLGRWQTVVCKSEITVCNRLNLANICMISHIHNLRLHKWSLAEAVI
jgi:hypothetical protein